MVCKNCAAMPTHIAPHASLLSSLLLGLLLATGPVAAEKADRLKPLNIVSEKGGRVDVLNQRTEFSGNVILSKGTLQLRAEQLDWRQTADGYFLAYASGAAGRPVSFSQARDVPGERIEGSAEQIEYDSRSDTVRFIGAATVRRMRGTAVADEVTGAVISYDNRSEVLNLEGGQASPQPNGRVRMVVMPRAAEAVGDAASAPATPPAALKLQPSPVVAPASSSNKKPS
jgi:lipopolysaccharide export system protein LptA